MDDESETMGPRDGILLSKTLDKKRLGSHGQRDPMIKCRRLNNIVFLVDLDR